MVKSPLSANDTDPLHAQFKNTYLEKISQGIGKRTFIFRTFFLHISKGRYSLLLRLTLLCFLVEFPVLNWRNSFQCFVMQLQITWSFFCVETCTFYFNSSCGNCLSIFTEMKISGRYIFVAFLTRTLASVNDLYFLFFLASLKFHFPDFAGDLPIYKRRKLQLYRPTSHNFGKF